MVLCGGTEAASFRVSGSIVLKSVFPELARILPSPYQFGTQPETADQCGIDPGRFESSKTHWIQQLRMQRIVARQMHLQRHDSKRHRDLSPGYALRCILRGSGRKPGRERVRGIRIGALSCASTPQPLPTGPYRYRNRCTCWSWLVLDSESRGNSGAARGFHLLSNPISCFKPRSSAGNSGLGAIL